MKTLRLETTAPFQGLAELVAYDEGLFEKEGIKIEWMDREKGVDKSPQMHITDHKDASRFLSHGKMMEAGQADLYNACEWGNYSRVEKSKVGSRQVGRRSIVTFAALVVRPDSPVQTPQQFANVPIGVPMYSGTHYLCLQMLEGFVPRELIKIGRVPNGSNYRFKMLMDKTIEATTLTEPYISLAEKMGCRVVISAFHHGTEVASDRVDAETYAAFNRARTYCAEKNIPIPESFENNSHKVMWNALLGKGRTLAGAEANGTRLKPKRRNADYESEIKNLSDVVEQAIYESDAVFYYLRS